MTQIQEKFTPWSHNRQRRAFLEGGQFCSPWQFRDPEIVYFMASQSSVTAVVQAREDRKHGGQAFFL